MDQMTRAAITAAIFPLVLRVFHFLNPQCGQVCEFAKGRIHRRGQFVGIGRLVYLDIAVRI